MAQIRHRNVRTIAFKEALNPVLPSSAAFVAHEAHHLLFGPVSPSEDAIAGMSMGHSGKWLHFFDRVKCRGKAE
jgi:hypothetical protein